MKKLTAMVLALSMLLTACGSTAPAEGGEASLKTETLTEAGTYTGEYEGLVINAADTVLEDVTAEKITIAKEVGDGDVTLKNVNVKTLEVYGGGHNSVHVINSAVGEVVSEKIISEEAQAEELQVRIVVEEGTKVDSFNSTNTIIVIKKASEGVGEVKANANTQVIVEEEAKAEKVVVADETATAELSGEVAAVEVAAPKAEVKVTETAKVTEVTVTEEATEAKVEVAGTVETVAVAAKAEVKVAEKAVVTEVAVSEKAAEAKVEVAGTVANVKVEAAKTEVKVAETATVAQVVVTEKAAETKVEVQGTVEKVATQTEVTVAGTGTVAKVEQEKENLVKAEEGSTATNKAEVEVKPVDTEVKAPVVTPAPSATPAPTAKPVATPAPTPVPHTHSYTSTQTKAPSCTSKGTMTYVCSCGDTYAEDIAKLGHSYDAGKVTTEATCATDGVKTFTCSRCNGTTTEVIKATGAHTYDAGVVTTEATCTNEGVKTYTCSVCNGTKTEAIATVAHSADSNGKCTYCGGVMTEDAFEAAIAEGGNVKLAVGTYTMLNTNKDVTISGTKDAVISLPMGVKGSGNTITFEGITIKGYDKENSFYTTQLNGAKKAVYRNCTIEGLITTYCNSEFINCVFENTFNDQYSVFDYGVAECSFTDCVFNTPCSKAIKLYNEGARAAILNVTGCTFNTSTADKAAVEIDSTYVNNGDYIVNITNCTINGAYTKLWNDKAANSNSIVTVDGVKQ